MVEVHYQPHQALLVHQHLIAYETVQEFDNKCGGGDLDPTATDHQALPHCKEEQQPKAASTPPSQLTEEVQPLMSLKNRKKEALTASTSMNQETLEQLKKDLLTKGGLIQDTTDTRSHLNVTGMTAPDTMITAFNIAKILLSLVATSSAKRTANEKIPEKVANILKAAALLLDDLTTTAQDTEQRLVDKIAAKIGHKNSLNNTANLELKNCDKTRDVPSRVTDRGHGE